MSDPWGPEEVRTITIVHQELWSSLVTWAESRGITLIRYHTTEDGLKEYIFAPLEVSVADT